MQISSIVAEWQINEFLEVLKKNKIKKSSSDFTKHLAMMGESFGVERTKHGQVDWNEFMSSYKAYWRLK